MARSSHTTSSLFSFRIRETHASRHTLFPTSTPSTSTFLLVCVSVASVYLFPRFDVAHGSVILIPFPPSSIHRVTDPELLTILEQPARVDGPKQPLPIPANLGLSM